MKNIKFTIGIAILLTIFSIIVFKNFGKENSLKNLNVKTLNVNPRIARYVFLDLGTNDGQSVKYFINKAPNKKNKAPLEGYGALGGKIWEIYVVEANPYFNSMLKNLKKYCENLGHTVNLYTETAAWVKNEKLVFYIDTVNINNNFWGSSLLKQHPDVVSSGFKNVTVNGIDIAEILAKYSPDDEIVLKIDIEGSEYDLLLHLIKTGTLHLVDIIAIEFHNRFLKDRAYSQADLEKLLKEYYNIFNIRSVPWF